MSSLLLEFGGVNQTIEIEFNNSANADFFVQNLRSFSRPADRITYAKSDQEVITDFLHRASQAKQLFKFEWNLDQLTQENFNLWHRDIETFDLEQHPPWSQEKGDLFCDLHTSLHQAESTLNNTEIQNQVYQRHSVAVSWMAPSVSWPELPVFTPAQDIKAGDVYTLFPHVGKTAWSSCQQNDNQNLKQSCRLPDACPPGFVIHLTENQMPDWIRQKLKNEEIHKLKHWYNQNSDQLQEMFSIDQMLYYHGEYCIGRVKNIGSLELLRTAQLCSARIV